MRTERRRICHLRVGPGQGPADVVSDLAHVAWRSLTDLPEFKDADPHLWPLLFNTFHGVFESRLVHYQGCGEREECRNSLRSVVGERPLPAEDMSGLTPVYTVETGRDPGRLTRLLAGLAHRRLKPGLKGPSRGRGFYVSRLAGELLSYLGERLYQGDVCDDCPGRKISGERRVWGEEAVAWRDVDRPKEVAAETGGRNHGGD